MSDPSFIVRTPVVLDGTNYGFWKTRIEARIKSIDRNAWLSVLKGWKPPLEELPDGKMLEKAPEKWSTDEVATATANDRARCAILESIDCDMYKIVKQCASAKSIWDQLELHCEGNTTVKKTKVRMLMSRFEKLRMREDESARQYFGEVMSIVIECADLGSPIGNEAVCSKLLRSMNSKFKSKVTAIEDGPIGTSEDYITLMGILKNHELNEEDRASHGQSRERKSEKNLAYTVAEPDGRDSRSSHGRDSRSSQGSSTNSSTNDLTDEEIYELLGQEDVGDTYALLSKKVDAMLVRSLRKPYDPRRRKFPPKTISNQDRRLLTRQSSPGSSSGSNSSKDWSKITCHTCHGLGHYSSECPSKDRGIAFNSMIEPEDLEQLCHEFSETALAACYDGISLSDAEDDDLAPAADRSHVAFFTSATAKAERIVCLTASISDNEYEDEAIPFDLFIELKDKFDELRMDLQRQNKMVEVLTSNKASYEDKLKKQAITIEQMLIEKNDLEGRLMKFDVQLTRKDMEVEKLKNELERANGKLEAANNTFEKLNTATSKLDAVMSISNVERQGLGYQKTVDAVFPPRKISTGISFVKESNDGPQDNFNLTSSQESTTRESKKITAHGKGSRQRQGQVAAGRTKTRQPLPKLKNKSKRRYVCHYCLIPGHIRPYCWKREEDWENGAGFFLHQPCSLLPQTFPNPFYPEEQCTLLISPPLKGECRKCRKPIQNFAYQSRDKYIHPMCAKAVEIKLRHKSHPQHPLVAIHKEMASECDACGEEHKGVFFSCVECSFLIHKDCASSPDVVKSVCHKHPLILTYDLYDLYDTRYSLPVCHSCRKVIFGQGLYFCGRCEHKFHMKCVSSSDAQILNSESQKEYWIHLPNERHRFPNWIKNFSKYMIRDDTIYSKLLVIKKCHNNHDLTFHENYPVATRDEDEDEDEEEDELVCDGCTQPIFKTSPIWGCFEPDCDFLLHHLCATNLPSDSEYFGEKLLIREPPGNSKYFFCSMFFCFHCGRPSNGFGCSFGNTHSNVCVECAFSPNTATHESHHGGVEQHILFQTGRAYKSSKPARCCSSTLLKESLLGYSCVTCEFRIHIGCAQLPKKVSHPDFHNHPLELVFTNDEKSFKKIQEDCFCEFCEEDIDQQYWFYRCAECDQSFHVKCIPSVGLLSNVKFGGRLNIPIHPIHPVILTRMLMEGNQRCHYCTKIIDGFVDDMAFRCDECDFWIHFKCARDCSNTDQRVLDKPRLWDAVISKDQFDFGD